MEWGGGVKGGRESGVVKEAGPPWLYGTLQRAWKAKEGRFTSAARSTGCKDAKRGSEEDGTRLAAAFRESVRAERRPHGPPQTDPPMVPLSSVTKAPLIDVWSHA